MKSFNQLMQECKESSVSLDERLEYANQLEAKERKYKYAICGWPSLYGTPWFCNSKIFACLLFFIRKFGPLSVEMYDNRTNKRIAG